MSDRTRDFQEDLLLLEPSPIILEVAKRLQHCDPLLLPELALCWKNTVMSSTYPEHKIYLAVCVIHELLVLDPSRSKYFQAYIDVVIQHILDKHPESAEKIANLMTIWTSSGIWESVTQKMIQDVMVSFWNKSTSNPEARKMMNYRRSINDLTLKTAFILNKEIIENSRKLEMGLISSKKIPETFNNINSAYESFWRNRSVLITQIAECHKLLGEFRNRRLKRMAQLLKLRSALRCVLAASGTKPTDKGLCRETQRHLQLDIHQ
eukprot:GDKJ01025685.1.p1 GENE.GDKJ01025685.1~~GDKJ01025685.1.p1  ORF type:complete len:264 (+),score=38.15 GDKJ01025685.1:34-825(+)